LQPFRIGKPGRVMVVGVDGEEVRRLHLTDFPSWLLVFFSYIHDPTVSRMFYSHGQDALPTDGRYFSHQMDVLVYSVFAVHVEPQGRCHGEYFPLLLLAQDDMGLHKKSPDKDDLLSVQRELARENAHNSNDGQGPLFSKFP